jgi:dimethylaniline monooxygenase (N-oxide forming)
VVAEKVTVHRASVKALLDNELYLDDGTHFPCDAVLCGTGWKRGLDIFSRNLLIHLGLPYPKEHESQETAAKWEKLVKEADGKVLAKYLILRNPPPHSHVYETRTPYRLYRGMAPLHDDTVLFMNHIAVANKLFGAEAQAMWAVAFFDHHIKLPSHAERERDISTWIAWCRRRYLSNGELGNYVVFDGVPYVDSLLDEIGVTAHRQKGWLHNFFAPFRPADLGKAWAEYLSVHSK